METIHRFSLRLLTLRSIPGIPLKRTQLPLHLRIIPVHTNRFIKHYSSSYSPSSLVPKAGWLLGLGEKKNPNTLPKIVKAGDPVLHEPARNVDVDEIGSDRIQKIIDDMIKVMRLAPGVGLAAPQIGIPLKIIVLEDTREYISYAPREEMKAQDRRPFDLLNPETQKTKLKSVFHRGVSCGTLNVQNKFDIAFRESKDRITYCSYDICSVDGFRAVVERSLEVKVTGFDRAGQPIKIDASGWQARILQHECDHLDGTLYVDKIVKRTFRTVENLDLPLADGCPKLGPR